MNRSGTARVSLTSRAALTNDPLRARADGRTPQGRRVRDLFRAYSAAMGSPSDPGTQAAILAAAELMVAAERARAEFLADGGDIEQLINPGHTGGSTGAVQRERCNRRFVAQRNPA